MVWLICALLAVAAIGFTLFVRERDIPAASLENPELKHLERRRQVLYDNLKDLQFEYHQGKLSDEDYQSLKAGFLGDLAGVMDAVERLQQASGVLQKEDIAAGSGKPKHRGGTPTEAGRCPSCQAVNTPGQRFCGQCGKPLPS